MSTTLPWESDVVEEILPHRAPMLWVDRVIALDLEAPSILAWKLIRPTESWVQGHFPDRPIMPGVFLLEAMAQAGGLLLHALGYDKTALFLSITGAKFRRSVHPNDALYLYVRALHVSSRGSRMEGRVLIDDVELACESEFSLAMVSQ